MTNNLIDSEIKTRLRNEMKATDEELEYLEKLLKIQKDKMNNERASGRQPSIVIDHFLYHGDLGHAIDLPLLNNLNIKYIINVCDCPLDDEIQKKFQVLWIFDLEDKIQSDIRKYFDQTNDLLATCKQTNDKVLVHCQAGISRSSSIVLAYLIRHDNYSLEEAYEYLLDRRPIASPNYGFLLQLIRYEKEIQNDRKQNPVKSSEDSSGLKTTF